MRRLFDKKNIALLLAAFILPLNASAGEALPTDETEILQEAGEAAEEADGSAENQAGTAEDAAADQGGAAEDTAAAWDSAVTEDGAVSGQGEGVSDLVSDVPDPEDVRSGIGDDASAEADVESGIGNDASAADIPDGIIEETEPETETESPVPEADPDAGIAKITETAEINDPLDTPDEIVRAESPAPVSASGRRIRRAQAAASYDGSFAGQLGENAKAIYDSKVSWYADGKNTGAWTYRFDRDLYTFRGVVTGAVKNPESGKYDLSAAGYDKKDASTKAGAEAAKTQMMRDMQSAADAFKHDHPEVFWIRSPRSYGFNFGINTASLAYDQGKLTAEFFISGITYTPVESFTGAGSLIADYQAKVPEAVSEVRAMADSMNTDGLGSQTPGYQALLVRAADQYLSARLYYDSDSLAVAVAGSEQEKAEGQKVTCRDECQIYTSAAAFLPEGGVLTHGVVCEGYAKAMKVLCDNLGIPAVCVAGLAYKSRSGSGHMWNLIEVGGIWYLTDPTWDDTGAQDHTESSRKYLLVSNYTNNTLLTSRAASGNFSGSTLTTEFVYPAVSETCYETSHRFGEGKVTEPTCTEKGYTSFFCICCGAENRENFTDALGHEYTDTSVVKPTCTSGGYTLHTCVRGDDSYRDSFTDALGHDYKDTVVKPTCTSGGYTIHTCVKGDDICKDSFTKALGHDYRVTRYQAPTCTAAGLKVYTCSRDGESYSAAVPALGHSYTKTVVSPTTKSRGYTLHTCRRCGNSFRDSYTDKLLKKTSLTKVSRYKTGRFRVTFKRTKKYTRYEIQYSARADFSDAKSKIVKGKKKTNTVTVRAGRKKTYYVRIRALSGKKTGAWSRVKKVRTR